MLQQALATVTCQVEARLLLSDSADIGLPTRLHYDATDPYAVTATFRLHDGQEVEWVLGRELLGGGLHRPSGEGDVLVRPSTRGGVPEVELVLSVPPTDARLMLPAETVAAFMRASHQVVPPGAETHHLDVGAAILHILSA